MGRLKVNIVDLKAMIAVNLDDHRVSVFQSIKNASADPWRAPVRIAWIRRLILDDHECAAWAKLWKALDDLREQIRGSPNSTTRNRSPAIKIQENG